MPTVFCSLFSVNGVGAAAEEILGDCEDRERHEIHNSDKKSCLSSAFFWNIRGLKERELSDGDDFLHILYGTSTLANFCGLEDRQCDIIGLAEHKRGGDFLHFPGYQIYKADRWDYARGQEGISTCIKDGGALLLVAENRVEMVERVLIGAPPETVAVLFKGALFGCQSPVAVIVIYGLCATSPTYRDMFECLGSSQIALLADFARELRLAGYEILLMRDMNAYTRTATGFDGESAIFGEGIFSGDKRRRSQCKQQRLNSDGRALLSLCEQAELTILNGLELPDSAEFSASSAVTRGASDSVIDYALVSAGLLSQTQ